MSRPRRTGRRRIRAVDALMTNSIVLMGLGGKTPNWEKANITAAIFYAKTQMGWKEPKQEVDVSGSLGVYDPSKLRDLSDEELTALEATVARLARSGSAARSDQGGDSA